jgi:hypothetical protein
MVILYINTTQRRAQVVELLHQMVAQGMDYEQPQDFNHPIVYVRSAWPNSKELLSLPLHVQCEELKYVSGNFLSIRVNTIDAEYVSFEPDYYI